MNNVLHIKNGSFELFDPLPPAPIQQEAPQSQESVASEKTGKSAHLFFFLKIEACFLLAIWFHLELGDVEITLVFVPFR